MKTDRIPGFAICAQCGVRNKLANCRSCGLLTCTGCRGGGQCILCFRERAASTRRLLRRERVVRFARRVVVIACVAISGFTAASAALFADPGRSDRLLLRSVPVELHVLERVLDLRGGAQDAGVVAVREHLAGAAHELVQRPGHANVEALHAAGE